MVSCKECNKEFENEASLHKHLKAHKLLLAEYYQKNFPRYDKFDGSIIKFRNKEQYLSTDFNDRENLKKWIEGSDPIVVRAYMKHILELRIAKKNLIWTPTQVELRTIMLPPIQVYDRFFGSYFDLCEGLGLKNRFKKEAVFRTPEFPPPYTVYIDTREQKPLSFVNHPSETKTLKFGDYACSDHDVSCRCYIERKSPQDFIGTFSGGMERFSRELDRAVEAQAYMVVICEDILYTMLRFNFSSHVYHKSKINSEFVFHNVRDIIQKYPNCQFLFVNGRERAADMIERIFDSDCSYKEVDLQLQYDLGRL